MHCNLKECVYVTLSFYDHIILPGNKQYKVYSYYNQLIWCYEKQAPKNVG
ncbi:MAG TPA: hypothetical protein VK645_03120 [Chitinophagaceae bacterium]|nr:hypothetical protein [Chitinophagaceae bacterium]